MVKPKHFRGPITAQIRSHAKHPECKTGYGRLTTAAVPPEPHPPQSSSLHGGGRARGKSQVIGFAFGYGFTKPKVFKISG
jgi:hypothetical protein